MVDAYLSVLKAGFLKSSRANFQTHGFDGIYGNKPDILEIENTRCSGG